MNVVKKFQKRVEDFICEHCTYEVKGDGFTNHCPNCLYSKHLDVFPGDRLEDCAGLMPVADIIRKGDGYTLVHKCLSCGATSRDHFRENDNIDALILASKRKK
ncbi:MAG: RNHCP domain-containing protein [Patescibacteria group bacterium]